MNPNLPSQRAPRLGSRSMSGVTGSGSLVGTVGRNLTQLAHLKTALKKLLNTLDSVPESSEEVKYDVDSTLRLYEVIFHAFIMRTPGYHLPTTGFWIDCDAEVREDWLISLSMRGLLLSVRGCIPQSSGSWPFKMARSYLTLAMSTADTLGVRPASSACAMCWGVLIPNDYSSAEPWASGNSRPAVVLILYGNSGILLLPV